MKQAVTITIGLFVVGFVTVLGIGFTTGNQPVNMIADNGGVPAAEDNSPQPGTKATTGTKVTQPPAKASTSVAPPPVAVRPSPTPATGRPAPTPSPSPTPTPGTAPTPTPTPPPPSGPQCGSGGSCTAAEVAVHNNASDCWVIFYGKAYNVTAWVPQHPGGTSVFNSTTCGQDIVHFMNGHMASAGKKHKHSSSAYENLRTYYIADIR